MYGIILQGRFASALLRAHADLNITEDSSHLFALGSGPKQDTLALIENKYKVGACLPNKF